MSKPKQGLMDLLGADDIWAYGHLTESQVLKVMAEHDDACDVEGGGQLPYVPAEYTYARWGFVSPEDGEEGWDRQLYLHVAPTRGAFRVTRIVTRDKWEGEQRRRSRADELQAWVLDRYPTAVVSSVYGGYDADSAQIRFQLPGLRLDVAAAGVAPKTVEVAACDLAEFQRLYQGKEAIECPPL